MNFYKFISSFSQVETIISLLAFIIACIFGYLAYSNAYKMKQIRKIIEKADTQTKANLAVSLVGLFSSETIPKLTKQQGFEVIKIQLEQRAKEFKSKLYLFKFGIALLCLVILVILIINAFSFSSHNTKQEDKNNKIISNNAPLSLIFCDFSASIDSQSKVKIVNEALHIFDDLFGNNNMYFFCLSPDSYSNYFFKSFDIEKPITFTGRAMLNKRKRQLHDSLMNIMNDLTKNIYQNTCIVKCIEQSIRELNNYTPADDTPLNLFFLSDMIEICPSTFRYHENNRPYINRSGLTFKKFKNLHIYPIVSSPSKFDPGNLNEFWKAAFLSFGYDSLRNLSPFIPDLHIKEDEDEY